MKIELQLTEDGSNTFYVPSLDEHYHSTHGAINEALHVYIHAGLRERLQTQSQLNVFEVGFGTGLNTYLSALEASSSGANISYYSIDNFIIPEEQLAPINYDSLQPSKAITLTAIHALAWNEYQRLNDHFGLQKIHANLLTYTHSVLYDVVYFDAFAPNKQADLWTEEIFSSLYNNMNPKGVLTTYCAKGSVRRMLQSAGFRVERLAGPKGKFEMLRATRPE